MELSAIARSIAGWDKATMSTNELATSQVALPKDVCDVVVAKDGYQASIDNFKAVSLASDNVFSDEYATQLGTVTGASATAAKSAST